VDGIAGVDITSVLFDTAAEPEAPPSPPPTWVPRPEPTSAQLLGEAVAERLTQPAEAIRSTRAAFRAPRRIATAAAEAAAAVGAIAKTGLRGASPSPLNVDIGPHRRFDWVRTELNVLKAIKNELGGTVNDVVLSAVTGALRRLLEERGEPVDDIELKAMVPVSVRQSEERGMTGNRVAAMMAPLPVYERDPVERLRIVRQAMAGLKQSRQAVGAQVLTELGGFAPPTVLAQAARLQARQRFFNLVVTNVPGPQFELFVLGRRLVDLFPMAPLAKRQALCIAAMSYHGKLNFGLLADYDAMADVDRLADALERSVEDLMVAAGVERPKKEAAAPVSAAEQLTASTEPNGRGNRRSAP
jgi:WS/DGAT/MGAT family acyltransferase